MEAENQVFLALGRLEGKVDSFLSGQKRHEERLDAMDERLTNLETAKAQGTGQFVGFTTAVRWGWVVLAAGLGLYADKIKEFIFR